MNIFLKAKDELGRRGWTKGELEDDTGKVCALGAIYAAMSGSPNPSDELDDGRHIHRWDECAHCQLIEEAQNYGRFMTEIARQLYDAPEYMTVISDFNDADSTTVEMVNHVFSHAAAEWDATHK